MKNLIILKFTLSLFFVMGSALGQQKNAQPQIPTVLQEVFDDVRRAYGIPKQNIKLMYSTLLDTANARFQDNTVIIYKKLFTLIQKKAAKEKLALKDALAFVIGHELAHAKLNHQGSLGFTNFTNTKLTVDDTKQEADADLYGCYYAHIAGYKSIDTYSKVLDWVYDANKLPKKNKNYKPLEERKITFDETFKKLQSNILPKIELAN